MDDSKTYDEIENAIWQLRKYVLSLSVKESYGKEHIISLLEQAETKAWEAKKKSLIAAHNFK